jgi:hypothetical protein
MTPVGSRYVVDVDQPRHRRVPGCRHAKDTAAVRPAQRSNWRRAGSYGVANFGVEAAADGDERFGLGSCWVCVDYLFGLVEAPVSFVGVARGGGGITRRPSQSKP